MKKFHSVIFLSVPPMVVKKEKKIKISLDNYDNNGNSLLKEKEKREFAFLCGNCCEINFINFELIINRETLKCIKELKLKKLLDELNKLLDELNKFELN